MDGFSPRWPSFVVTPAHSLAPYIFVQNHQGSDTSVANYCIPVHFEIAGILVCNDDAHFIVDYSISCEL